MRMGIGMVMKMEMEIEMRTGRDEAEERKKE